MAGRNWGGREGGGDRKGLFSFGWVFNWTGLEPDDQTGAPILKKRNEGENVFCGKGTRDRGRGFGSVLSVDLFIS